MILYIMNMMTVQWYPISIIILLSESESFGGGSYT